MKNAKHVLSTSDHRSRCMWIKQANSFARWPQKARLPTRRTFQKLAICFHCTILKLHFLGSYGRILCWTQRSVVKECGHHLNESWQISLLCVLFAVLLDLKWNSTEARWILFLSYAIVEDTFIGFCLYNLNTKFCIAYSPALTVIRESHTKI